MGKWFSPGAAGYIRKAIAASNNEELLLLGTLHEDKLTDVRVLEGNPFELVTQNRGNERLVVICNHPSGDLTPSGTDITTASRLAREGIGFAIVDNLLEGVYILTEPAPVKVTASVPPKLVRDTLGSGGHISRVMPFYEERPQQLEMAVNLALALNEGFHVLAEAGTGLGKSLAYLVPAIIWARENKRRVVISTNTINLQEQLLYKDIPLLQRGLPFEFTAVLVKGRANYLCKRKFRELVQRDRAFVEEEDIPTLGAMLAWEKTTGDGSKSDLPFNPRGLWELVCSESDTCLRNDCQFYRECFFHRARREALNAQVLIANHSLLFADIALRSRGIDPGVLPEYHGLVFDEAHNVERAATDWLGARVTRMMFSRLLGRLYTIRANRAKGLLVILENKLAAMAGGALVSEYLELIRQELVPECLRLGAMADEFFLSVTSWGETGTKMRLPREWDCLPGGQRLAEMAQGLFLVMEGLHDSLGRLRNRMEYMGPRSFEQVLPEAIGIDGLRGRMKGLETDLREVLFGHDDSLVRWLEISPTGRGPRAALCYAPLTVRTVLKENLWGKLPSVILTSATLAVNRSFDYVRERLGLDELPKVKELQFGSPFLFEKQVLLGVVTDLPEPTVPGFQTQIIPAIRDSLLASRGKGLVLFTSFAALKATAAALVPELKAQGINLLSQGEIPRHKLLEKFQADTNSVLMATASFWEGVDVPGESLSNLILTRLPFNVPDEPVFQARMEEIKKQGKNPFYDLQIPQAVLRFKQGFGRLIRNKNDQGVVLVLDKRVATKRYGHWFINSLPPCPLRTGSLQEILTWHGEFLE